jgi:hypothetical protein
MELEQDEVEAELAAEAASEGAGVPTEDVSERPESDEELVSAVEEAPELVPEPITPETGTSPEDVGEAAPPEEREEAEQTNLMSPDHSPEGREGLTAAEGDKPNMETRIMQEEPDNAPGGAVDDIAAEEEPATVTEQSEPGSETLEPSEDGDEESIESIVEDLKRERGQNQ